MMEEGEAGAARYRTGVVIASKPGFAKVSFPDLDGMASDWLPMVFPKTLRDRFIWTLDRDEQVACLLDAHLEDGCILGAIYSDADVPPDVSPDVHRGQFEDGGYFEYDRSSGALSVNVIGDATINVQGNAFVKAAKATIDAVCDFLKLCRFVGGALFPGGVGGGGGLGSTIPGAIRADQVQTAAGIDLDGHHHTGHGDGAPTSAAQN